MHFKCSIVVFHTMPTKNDTKKSMHASAEVGDMPFGVSPDPAFDATLETKNLSFFDLIYYTFPFSPLEVEGQGVPPPSSPPRAFTGARRSCSHVGFLLLSITCKTNNGGMTPARAFVGTPHRCGFQPSNVDTWLIRNTLVPNLRL